MFRWWRAFHHSQPSGHSERLPAGPYEARLAFYQAADALPQVTVLTADDCLSLIDTLCKKALHASQERGGVIPLLALREIIENLLHASFRDVVVTVLSDGSVVVSDHGPGIPDKASALRPGFTTASQALRRYIRGVGSGLPVAQESLRAIGGSLRIEENLGGGTVVSLLVPQHEPLPGVPPVSQEGTASPKDEYTQRPRRQKHRVKNSPGDPAAIPAGEGGRVLTPRQERLLRLFTVLAEVGPSTAAAEAGLSLASAHRELVALERAGLLDALPGGKRRLSSRGADVLAAISKR
ncbi:MAG: ATP-binding protein [Betaproteobacteria bacterium]